MMSSILKCYIEEPVGYPGGDVYRQLRREIWDENENLENNSDN